MLANDVAVGSSFELINAHGATGFFALLKQGETGLTLAGQRVVMAGEVARPIGETFGAVLMALLQPKELLVWPRYAALTELWEIARTHAGAPQTLTEAAQRLRPVGLLLTANSVTELGWWRQHVVALWALAVRSQISLPALNFILVLPLIAFFLVIIRNVIGLETFGTFSPMLLSLAFLKIGRAHV